LLPALGGFGRVFLKACASKPVTIQIDRRQLQYWSVARKTWVDAGATRTLRVGGSSAETPLQAVIR